MSAARRERAYWIREALAASPGEPCPPLRGETDADVVVLGGGFTGLWTAWFLTERSPGIDVVVLEQDICGAGASGRNGGFIGGWWDTADELVARYGESDARLACDVLEESVGAIVPWCDQHGVDAWQRPVDYLEVASSPAQDGAWLAAVEACRRIGRPEGFREWSAEEVGTVCASPALRAGAAMRGATVQPARLARGLRRVLIERGVRIFEGTPAVRHTRGSGPTVTTPEGTVRAGQAVLGLNAWSARWPRLRRSIVVRGSYILLTAPAPERIAKLGWTGGQPIVDLRTALHYFRTTPDGRIAFGGVGRALGSRVGPRYDHDPASLAMVEEGFRRIFPSFADVPIEEGWGGPVDVSPTNRPWIGTVEPGVHTAFGFTGHGLAQTHLAGRTLSAIALDADDQARALPMVGGTPKRFPPEPFLSMGVHVVQRAILRRDRLEDRGERAGPLTRFLSTLPRRLGYPLGSG